ncbi:hypothetical protein [Sphingopyxis sp.]|jgi:hypothetical protein|uniref:hypothetical protein n=1 Tax=Sphingopyxis sp. TaxID=1908224 RepID=UPI003F71E552
MNLFGPKRPLAADEWEWQLAGFRWLLEEFEGLDKHRVGILATPDGACFPDSKQTGDARAAELLGQIMTIADIADWPVRLVMDDGEPELRAVSQIHALTPETGWAMGTFQIIEDGTGGWLAEIVASRQQIGNEAALVATLAHEVAHYLLSSTERPVPGGEDCHELLTDLAAVFLGFGIFLGNGARFSRHTQGELGTQYGGWFVAGSQGYLSERALMTALAISETLAGRDPMAAAAYLKPHLAQDLKQAARYIAKRDIFADIRAIDLSEYGAPAAAGA